jgi:diadenosine tetraphosphate (Ap4A) HIT family hydrolase
MSAPPLLPGADPSCPFCAIASAFPPVAPSSTFDSQSSTSTKDIASDPLNPENTFPPSYVILSTPDVISFLDIAPLTRGHILVATRRHLVKTVNLTTTEGAEVRTCAFLEYQSFCL